MGDSVSYSDAGFLVRRSKNTIIGYSTQERGRIYVPDNGVPYPQGMKSVIERVMEKEDSEEELGNLEILFNIISRKTPYEIFMRCIAILKGEAENGKRGVVNTGLLKKVLETEEIPETLEPSKEPDTKYEKEPPEPPRVVEVEEEMDSTYNLREYLSPEPKKKTPKTRQASYPYLTEKELNMPLDNLVDSILRKIYRVKKSIKKDPKTKKQRDLNRKREERLNKLGIKYRSVINPFKDGVFDKN